MQHVTECHVDPLPARAGEVELRGARGVVLGLAGMGCQNCVNRVRNALLRVTGVLEVEVDSGASVARVLLRRDPEVHTGQLVDAVAGAGRGTHHRYLAVPLKSRFEGDGETGAAPERHDEER